MKILQVIDRLDIGGAEKVFVTITTLLYDKGVAVAVLLFNNGGALEEDLPSGIEQYSLNRQNKYALSKLYEAHSICRRFNIVHVHMRHCYAYIHLARSMFFGNYKIILHDHYGIIAINRQVPFNLRLLKPAYYIGVSRDLQAWAQKELGIPKQNTFFLQNTVFPNNSDTINNNMAVYNLVVVSNFRRSKNIKFAIKLCKQQGWQLTIYGQPVDLEYYDEVLSLIGNVQHICIAAATNSPETQLNNYSLAIHPSIFESGPLVLMEYMAKGIPFIAYKTGEVADTIGGEFPMLFMDTFDEDKWIARIHQITATQGIGEQLKAAFRKYFSADKHLDNCLEIYQQIHS